MHQEQRSWQVVPNPLWSPITQSNLSMRQSQKTGSSNRKLKRLHYDCYITPVFNILTTQKF